MSRTPTEVTRLIHRIHGGDDDARQDLWTLVYDELRRLASRQMVGERSEHTLQPTALVHEAWLRLSEGPRWDSRGHFFAVAAEAMRRILIDHARRRSTERRGGGSLRLTRFDMGLGPSHGEALEDAALAGLPDDLEALDAALTRLEETGKHDRKCQVVKLRFFVGLSVEATAELLETSASSVKRDWEFAKAWLSREIGSSSRRDGP